MSNDRRPARRMGPPGSENWHTMLDGAEVILREEGHAALTSRRVAEQIGVKQRLIYYYFRTMDDLIVETFRRLSERELKRMAEATENATPLREIWDAGVNMSDARLISEFMVLANRIEGLATQVIHFIEDARKIQVIAMTAAIERAGLETSVPPAALAIIASSLALTLSREDVLGVQAGHAEAVALIEDFLAEVEPS